MSITINATAGSATANSFVTLAEAQTYMDGRLNGALWTAAATDDQNRALVEATREISVLSWLGNRTDTTQVLAWPRTWCPNPDQANFVYSYYTSTTIPQRVKDATSELAFQFIKAGTTDIAALDATLGVTEKTVDVLTTRYQAYQRPTGLARFPSVMRTISPLLESASGTFRVVRG